jgi:hypothetical protein
MINKKVSKKERPSICSINKVDLLHRISEFYFLDLHKKIIK